MHRQPASQGKTLINQERNLQLTKPACRYELLDPPKPNTLLWDGGLAQNMDEAKDIFNAGIRKIRVGLDYYSLEKHPVMHCNLILEITELYRCSLIALSPLRW